MPFLEDDDELSNMPTTQVVKTNNTVNTPKVQSKYDEVENLSVEFGDKKLAKGEGLELYRPTKDHAIRFWMNPSAKPQGAQVHFIAGSNGKNGGTYRCLAVGDDRSTCPCCMKGIKRELRVVVLAAVYVNADATGKLLADTVPELSIGYVRLSRQRRDNQRH
jgi:hypothetical protein